MANSPRLTPTQYLWAHAVNSQDLLTKTLEQSSINAIEADIIFSETKNLPVMGHPPQTDGDLALHDFLLQLQKAGFQQNEQGSHIVKLDFKSATAFKASLSVVRDYLAATGNASHVWINADIMPGPGNVPPKFDADEFLDLAATLEGTVLSIGWTTAGEIGEYTSNMVDDMLAKLSAHKTSQVVTFPIKATWFQTSWDALKKLYTANSAYGTTLWWSKTPLQEEYFDWLFNTLERDSHLKDRTFYDIMGFDTYWASKMVD